MHPSRLTLVVAALVGGAALLFDFVTADLTGDVIGWDATAWPGVAALAVAAALALLGDRQEGFPAPATIIVVLLTALATLFAISKIVDAAAAARLVRAAEGKAAIGIGAWLLAAASCVGLAGAVATSSRRVF
ncbi:MAG: hypothetical protein ACE5GC_06555 [Acidimicrobiia bacterium]